jgi:hypothetical protein
MTVATCVGMLTAFADVVSQAEARFSGFINFGASSGEEYAAESQPAVIEQVTVSKRQQALTMRAAWMRHMGLDEAEIETLCRDDGGPVDLQEEIDNLQAAYKPKQIIPSYEEMKTLVNRVAPSKIVEQGRARHLR